MEMEVTGRRPVSLCLLCIRCGLFCSISSLGVARKAGSDWKGIVRICIGFAHCRVMACLRGLYLLRCERGRCNGLGRYGSASRSFADNGNADTMITSKFPLDTYRPLQNPPSQQQRDRWKRMRKRTNPLQHRPIQSRPFTPRPAPTPDTQRRMRRRHIAR